jgi:hypothetical protein
VAESHTYLLIGGCLDGQFIDLPEDAPAAIDLPCPAEPTIIGLFSLFRVRQPDVICRYRRVPLLVDGRTRLNAIYALESLTEGQIMRRLIAGYRRG